MRNYKTDIEDKKHLNVHGLKIRSSKHIFRFVKPVEVDFPVDFFK